MRFHWLGLLAVGLWGCGDSRDVSVLEDRLASATERITVLEQELTRLTQIEDALASLEAKVETTDGMPGDSQSLIDLAARLDEVETTAGARATALEAKTAAISVEVFEGHPTLVVTGVNVHLRNGNGATDATNGLGNLVLGYPQAVTDDSRGGSHIIAVGDGHTYTSNAYAGVVVGLRNHLQNQYTAVVGGRDNTASGAHAAVSGGYQNTAAGTFSAVTGGSMGTAAGSYSSVTGGSSNVAVGPTSSVTGGFDNSAEGSNSSVTGGSANRATGSLSSITAGSGNVASGYASSVTGGGANKAEGKSSVIVGGFAGAAVGELSSISGGTNNTANRFGSSVTGGSENSAQGLMSSISGGWGNHADGQFSSIGGGNSIVRTGDFRWSGGTFADP